MRLIDADVLMEQMKHRREFVGRPSDPVCLVEDAPTIEPVKHGQWEEDKNYNAALQRCSLCKRLIYYGCLMNYCPHCGARMDEVSE